MTASIDHGRADWEPAEAAGLRGLASCGGCAAKADPFLVATLVAATSARTTARSADPHDDELLVGLDPADDAAVYRLDDDRALVATIDFFPPIADDAADYGAIAAANAVSDVYAMGGRVELAMIVSGFPRGVRPVSVQAAVEAATDVVGECGGRVMGGHSITCTEPVFGLAVLGFVHPERIWRTGGARPGDVLVLSKPLGTGLLVTAGEPAGMAAAIEVMRTVNRSAADALGSCPGGPNAVTDVTGYGLVGHAWEMAARSDARLRLRAGTLPAVPGARAAAARGVRTSADSTTRAALDGHVLVAHDVPADLSALLYDPQTSGGLLAAVPPEHVEFLCRRGFSAVGSVHAGPPCVEVVLR